MSYAPIAARLTARQRVLIENFVTQGRGQYIRHDPVLGWVPIAEANAGGMRDDRDYAPRPPPGRLRIAAFGDSFTYSADVALAESWTKQLARAEPSFEVLNYGSGAYGFDQAYLRYRLAGTDYSPHIVLVGYMSENLERNVNVFRPFYSRSYASAIFTKPRFVLRGDDLVLLENPLATREDYARFLRDDMATLRRLGERDYHYQIGYHEQGLDILPSVRLVKMLLFHLRRDYGPAAVFHDDVYNTESEAYRITLKLFDAFYREVLENGQLPVVLVFPEQREQTRSRNGEPPGYGPLLGALQSRGYRVIDLLDALKPAESQYLLNELVVEWGHFSPLGNELAAVHIAERLRTWGLTAPAPVREAAAAERARLGM